MKLYFENKKRMNEDRNKSWDADRFREIVIDLLNDDPDRPDGYLVYLATELLKKEGRQLSSETIMEREFDKALAEWEGDDEDEKFADSDNKVFDVIIKYYDGESEMPERFTFDSKEELEDYLDNNGEIEWWDYDRGQLTESKKRINEAFERFDTTKLIDDLNDKLLTSIRQRFLTFEKDLSGIKDAYEGIVDWIHAPFGDTVYGIQIRFNERYAEADKDEVVDAILKLMSEYGMKIRKSYDTPIKGIFQIEYFWLDDFSNISRHIYEKIESLYSSEIDRINNL